MKVITTVLKYVSFIVLLVAGAWIISTAGLLDPYNNVTVFSFHFNLRQVVMYILAALVLVLAFKLLFSLVKSVASAVVIVFVVIWLQSQFPEFRLILLDGWNWIINFIQTGL